MRWVEGGDRGGVPGVCVVVGFWGEGGDGEEEGCGGDGEEGV